MLLFRTNTPWTPNTNSQDRKTTNKNQISTYRIIHSHLSTIIIILRSKGDRRHGLDHSDVLAWRPHVTPSRDALAWRPREMSPRDVPAWRLHVMSSRDVFAWRLSVTSPRMCNHEHKTSEIECWTTATDDCRTTSCSNNKTHNTARTPHIAPGCLHTHDSTPGAHRERTATPIPQNTKNTHTKLHETIAPASQYFMQSPLNLQTQNNQFLPNSRGSWRY